MSASSLPPQHILDAIQTWVEVESPTYHPSGVNAMMDLVEQEVQGLPVIAERLSGRDGLGDILLLRAGPDNGEDAILLMSHLDTVHPVGTLEADFPLRVEGDRFYGPGVFDMKASAYIALRAFKQVVFDGRLKRPLLFLFTPDEEIGSPTTRELIETLAQKASCALVTEPGREGGKVVTARKGVGRFEVTIEGRASHSGTRPQDGISAIREAAKQILDIEAMTDFSRGVTTNVGMITGGSAVNVVPQYCQFTVDLRVVSITDGDEFERRLLALRPHDPNVRMTVIGGMNRPPFERTEGVGKLFDIVREVGAELGQVIDEIPQTGGGSDGNFTAALGVPTIDGLGVDGAGAHTLQEYIELSSIEPRRLLLSRLLERLAC